MKIVVQAILKQREHAIRLMNYANEDIVKYESELASSQRELKLQKEVIDDCDTALKALGVDVNEL